MRAMLRRRWRIFVVAGVVLLVVLAGVVAFNPWTANHFGYALPGADGLPAHFFYQGITYSNPDLCAGASDCQPSAAARETQAQLNADGIWPLRQVSSITTLFGASHPVLEPVNDPSMIGAGGPYASDVHPFVLFVPDGTGSYFVYMRPGGP